MNLPFADRAQKLQQIIRVLESKMKDSFEIAGGAEDIKTEIKCLLL